MFAGMRIHVPTDGDHTAAFGLAIKLKPKKLERREAQSAGTNNEICDAEMLERLVLLSMHVSSGGPHAALLRHLCLNHGTSYRGVDLQGQKSAIYGRDMTTLSLHKMIKELLCVVSE